MSSPALDVDTETATLQDNYGLGFGGVIGENGTLGLNLQADYNFLPTDAGFSQLHLMGSSSTRNEGGFLNSNISGTRLSILSNRLALTLRWVFTSGFYLGAGYGKTTGNITYASRDYFTSSSQDKRRTFTFASTFVPLDIGWQGNDGYYFSVGLQPSIKLTSRSSYKEGALPPDAPKLANMRKLNAKADDSSIYYFDFGWYIR